MKGYFSMGLCGYEVKVSSDTDSVKFKFVGCSEEDKWHKARLYTTGKGFYFKTPTGRVYLNDCLRTH